MQTSSTSSTSSSSTNQVASKTKALTSDDFIQMMIAQLQHQDPMQPTTNSELMSQMSQISQLQSNTSLQSTLKTLASQSQIGAAGAMIGKTVAGLDDTDKAVQGVVTSVRVEGESIYLELDSGKKLGLSRVTSIASGPTATK